MLDEASSRVLEMCRRFGREFTLAEIVRRVIDERPELVVEFANVWAVLLRARSIRVCKSDLPATYEVIPDGPR